MPLYQIQSDFTVYAGETLSGSDYIGLYVLNLSGRSPGIAINGTFDFTGLTSTWGGSSAAIQFEGGFFRDAPLTISATGVLRATGASVVGVTGSWTPAFVNHGLVDVRGTAGVANGVNTSYGFTNTGTIRVVATTGAGAVSLREGPFSNSGTIEAQAGTGSALGVSVANFSSDFVNSGTIRVSDGSAAVESTAVSITPYSLGIGVLRNSGLIQGDYALKVQYFSAARAQEIVNTGTMIGKLDLTGGRVRVENTGTVTGDVTMGQGDDVWSGALGQFTGVIRAGIGADSLATGAGADTLMGEAGADTISGGAGDDLIVGGAGADSLMGGAGLDTVSYAAAAARVTVDLESGMAWGGEGEDAILGFERAIGGVWGDVLRGAATADILTGGYGHDTLEGRAGDDSLLGEAGADSLFGGGGNDTLTGGAGADLFRASPDGGVERITDFNAAQGDRVLIDPGVAFTLRQDGADAVVDLGGGSQVVLVGVQLATLPADFLRTSVPASTPNPVTASTTATVTVANYTVPEGETFLFSNQDGVVLNATTWLYEPTDVRVAGELSVVAGAGATASGGAINGIRIQQPGYGEDRIVEIMSGGRLSVDTSASSLIARGVFGPSIPRMLANNGEIDVLSRADAYGVYSGGSSWYTSLDLVNTGAISVVSQQANAYGVYMPSGERFSNSGLIEAHGAQTTYGVYFYQGSSTFFNTGTVRATDSSATKESVAVQVDYVSFYGANFNNAGTLQGEIALRVVSNSSFEQTTPGASSENFINSGQMLGRVEFGAQRQNLTNSGLVDGAINFGSGGDTYDGRLGRVTGMVSGGEGDDSLMGGASFDYLHGNTGDDSAAGAGGGDWVVGGQGNDNLDGGDGEDIVLGNLGADWIDGGAGADQVRGGQGDDMVRGDAGADWLSGDRGNDTIVGGAGADIFHCFAEAGLDRVLDFSAAEGDRVNLLTASTYAVAQVGADTVITVGGSAQMVLVGVTLSTLPEGWIYVG